ncbi:MAG: CheF family chemotaxis protein [Halobaculum sp.]
MSESVVADFVGRFYTPDVAGPSGGVAGDVPRGRVLLSEDQLVLAADETEEHVPLSAVFDVKMGEVPDYLKPYFDDTVTVAYTASDERRVVAIEGDPDHIEKFGTVLFKTILNGTDALVKHPARRGGRVTSAEARRAKLALARGAVGFRTPDDRVEIDLDTVVDVQRADREFGGDHPVVQFRHLVDGTAQTTEAAIASRRLTNLLGRYVRTRYGDVQSELEEVGVSNEEEEVLVALYTAPGVSLANVVDFDPQRLTVVLRSLREKSLIAETDDDTELTVKGQMLASQRIEQVND